MSFMFQVSDIKIPPRFQGAATNFQDDIAILRLSVTIELKTHVRPVCLDFNVIFDQGQLAEGKVGKVRFFFNSLRPNN